ncbi:hypothetical protein [Kineococcus rhizosphaerae]|uniref:hypothetical protein n=1 Tax=Kineococcus rhizosphaerae TaxID=559628 RepID=UPI000D07E18D|nr:hypothetical protein [Kineococcus rhizosphaerae]
MSPAWFPVVLLGLVVLVALWWVAIVTWTRRPMRGTSGAQERRNDGSLTPAALEKLIHENTRLGTKPDRNTDLGWLWDQQQKDQTKLLDLQAKLNSERIRVTNLSQELKTTQDVLADAVQRLQALEASQRGSRLRSLLR